MTMAASNGFAVSLELDEPSPHRSRAACRAVKEANDRQLHVVILGGVSGSATPSGQRLGWVRLWREKEASEVMMHYVLRRQRAQGGAEPRLAVVSHIEPRPALYGARAH